jgi:hypothetical protein
MHQLGKLRLSRGPSFLEDPPPVHARDPPQRYLVRYTQHHTRPNRDWIGAALGSFHDMQA